jgi:membrane protein DedA with SNARE-associated domain
MEHLILRFGLAAVFIGAVVEGDMTLVLCGVTAHLGLMSLPLGVTVSAAGCFTGDLAWYLAGRFHSDSIRRLRAYRSLGPAVERVAGRVGPWQIAASRLLYGTRIVTMLFWGVHRLPFSRFALVDGVGCTVWAALLGTLGFAASTGAVLLLGEVKRVEYWLLGALAACVALYLVLRRIGADERRVVAGAGCGARGESGGSSCGDVE